MSLFDLVELGDTGQLAEKLQELNLSRELLCSRNEQGHTPLDLAALLGRLELLNLLIECGGPELINAANKSGS